MINDILQKQKLSKLAEARVKERKALGLAVRAALAYAKLVVKEELGDVVPDHRKAITKRLMEHRYYRYLGELDDSHRD